MLLQQFVTNTLMSKCIEHRNISYSHTSLFQHHQSQTIIINSEEMYNCTSTGWQHRTCSVRLIMLLYSAREWFSPWISVLVLCNSTPKTNYISYSMLRILSLICAGRMRLRKRQFLNRVYHQMQNIYSLICFVKSTM